MMRRIGLAAIAALLACVSAAAQDIPTLNNAAKSNPRPIDDKGVFNAYIDGAGAKQQVDPLHPLPVTGGTVNPYPGSDYAKDRSDFPDAKSGTALGAPGDPAPLPGANGTIVGQLKALIAQSASYTSAGTATASGTLPSPGTMPTGGAPRGFGYSCDNTTPAGSKTTLTLSGAGTLPFSPSPNFAGREGISAVAVTAVTGCTFQALY